jgi:TetR/AcrR family hemagglutinin/protease transcriptional regulator
MPRKPLSGPDASISGPSTSENPVAPDSRRRRGGKDGASAAPLGGRRRRTRLAPETRRAELLSIALAVFARRGLGEARHAEIASEAGVSVATVFVYFPTREALVDAVTGEVGRFFLDMAARVHAQALPADRILLAHIRAFADSLDASPHHVRVWLDWSTAVREQFWQRYLEFLDRMLAIMRSTIERGQREGDIAAEADSDNQARLLVGSAHMLALMKLAGSPPEKLEHFFATLLSAVIGRRSGNAQG